MKVVVGLGNPGNKYAHTRHNVGFEVVDYLIEGERRGLSSPWKKSQGSWVAELVEDSEKLLLVKPQSYMNCSGRSVRELVDFYQLPLEELLVVCDDISLPLGKLRVRARGTHGGHNGLRDIQQHLGTTEYSRLRVGVGAPDYDAIDHVLGAFRPSERPVIKDAIARAAQAVLFWAANSVQACMNRYNSSKGDEP
jgi:PTH1 family peptidyl-tRNA hydrolase